MTAAVQGSPQSVAAGRGERHSSAADPLGDCEVRGRQLLLQPTHISRPARQTQTSHRSHRLHKLSHRSNGSHRSATDEQVSHTSQTQVTITYNKEQSHVTKKVTYVIKKSYMSQRTVAQVTFTRHNSTTATPSAGHLATAVSQVKQDKPKVNKTPVTPSTPSNATDGRLCLTLPACPAHQSACGPVTAAGRRSPSRLAVRRVTLFCSCPISCRLLTSSRWTAQLSTRSDRQLGTENILTVTRHCREHGTDGTGKCNWPELIGNYTVDSPLTRAPLGYFYNAPHWGGGAISSPTGGGGYFEPTPLISETTGPILKIQPAFKSPGKTVEGKQILLTSGSRVTSQVRSKSKCSTFWAW